MSRSRSRRERSPSSGDDRRRKRRHSRSRERRRSREKRRDSPVRSIKREQDIKGEARSSDDDVRVVRRSRSGSFDRRLQRRREEDAERKKLSRKEAKETESYEDKRARRLAKKLNKQKKLAEMTAFHEQCLQYTNDDNPFGDSNLTETFVWGKKFEKEGIKKPSTKLVQQRKREALMHNAQELDKVKKSREERERQRAEREAERELLQRDREAEQFTSWTSQEDRFHLTQARQRSRIRLQEGRAKPIDLLARYIDCATDPDVEMGEVEMREANAYLYGLGARDLEDLLKDIEVYQQIDAGKERAIAFWNDVFLIAQDELRKLNRKDPRDGEGTEDHREPVNDAVQKAVDEVIRKKTQAELALMEVGIKKKITCGGPGVDIGYWEALLEKLKPEMSRARLRDLHQQVLRRNLFKLKQEQMNIKIEEPGSDEEEKPGTSQQGSAALFPSVTQQTAREKDGRLVTYEEVPPDKREDYCLDLFDSGGYSPVYVMETDLERGAEITDPVEEATRLSYAREKYKQSGVASSQQDAKMLADARKGMDADEAQFSVEMPLAAAAAEKTYLWSDKYKPRKPRYFNRVHTGFEWNKYNQTHYDLDNPPPKIVQGYKFNLFYPDLLDPTSVPEFDLVPEEDVDFAMLKFHAGPPYEDIAFRIVNREWEIDTDKGFRCQFQNGVFQLWFHFKKYRYRR